MIECFQIKGGEVLAPRALKPSCHNLCSRIRSDSCLLTNTATKTHYYYADGVVVFKGSPIRYNDAWFCLNSISAFLITY